MERRIDVINKHIDVIRKISDLGKTPSTLLEYLKIYKCYCDYLTIKSKMLRYTFVSEELNIDETRVRRVINYLESKF